MNHLDEEQLMLHYYGESEDALTHELHLDQCEQCRAQYGSLQRALNTVDGLQVPERAPDYEQQVWRSIERDVAFAPAGALAPPGSLALGRGYQLRVVARNRFSCRSSFPGDVAAGPVVVADADAGERVLLAAVADYLERSQGVLVELANANTQGPLDISMEQRRAEDLVSENRLYRQTALYTGQVGVANVLEELERALQISRTRRPRCRLRSSKACASAWMPAAFYSRSECWARMSGAKKRFDKDYEESHDLFSNTSYCCSDRRAGSGASSANCAVAAGAFRAARRKRAKLHEQQQRKRDPRLLKYGPRPRNCALRSE